jgi:O-antigen/teichoic acid export membrane protein
MVDEHAMGLRSKYAKTALLSTILTYAGFVFNLIYGKILAVVITDVNQMGIIAALNTVATLVLGLSTLGILYTITQKASKSHGAGDNQTARSIIWKGTLVYYVSSLPLAAILVLGFLMTLNLLVWFIPMVIFLLSGLIMSSQRTAMNSMVEPDKGVVFSGFYRWSQWGLSLGLMYLFIFLSLPDFFVGIIYGWVVSTVVFCLIGFLLTSKYMRSVDRKLSPQTTLFLTFGLPVFGAYVLRLIGQQIDKLFIMYTTGLVDPSILANYFFAVRIASQLNAFSFSLTAGLVALLGVLYGINELRMQRAHAAVLRFLLVITVPFYAAIAAFGEPIIILLLDPRYFGIRTFLPILTFAFLFELIIVVLLMGRRASGERRLIPLIWGGVLGLKVVLLFFFGFDLLGIASAILISNLVFAFITGFYLRSEVSLGWFWIKLSVPILLVLIAGIISLWLALDVVLSLLVCLIAVFISLFFSLRLRLLSVQDVNIIRSVMPARMVRYVNFIARIGGYPTEIPNED